MDSLGYYITMALLGAAAAYGLANKSKPKPKLTSGKKKTAIVCFAIAAVCAVLAAAVALLPHASGG